MKRKLFGVLGVMILLGMPSIPWGTEEAVAGVGVSVNIGLPPLVFAAPPALIVIPGTYVYSVPDIEVGFFFYQGFWYRPYEGRWYWASSYGGPWAYIEIARVPRVLVELPPGSWRVPHGYHRIPYAEVRENWRRWEHERHWDRDRDWHAGWRGRPEGRGHEEGNERHEGWGRGHEEGGRGHEEHGRH